MLASSEPASATSCLSATRGRLTRCWPANPTSAGRSFYRWTALARTIPRRDNYDSGVSADGPPEHRPDICKTKEIECRGPNAELVLVPGGTLITATPEEGRA